MIMRNNKKKQGGRIKKVEGNECSIKNQNNEEIKGIMKKWNK